MTKTLTGVGGILSAAHLSREGVMHGHTWEVTAWWSDKPDAVQKQAELAAYLQFFDHSILAESVAWAEDLAERIAEDLGCSRVEISRPLERLYAIHQPKETRQ